MSRSQIPEVSPRNDKLQVYAGDRELEAKWIKYTQELQTWGIAAIRNGKGKPNLSRLAILGMVLELCSHWKLESTSTHHVLAQLIETTIQEFVKGRPKERNTS